MSADNSRSVSCSSSVSRSPSYSRSSSVSCSSSVSRSPSYSPYVRSPPSPDWRYIYDRWRCNSRYRSRSCSPCCSSYCSSCCSSSSSSCMSPYEFYQYDEENNFDDSSIVNSPRGRSQSLSSSSTTRSPSYRSRSSSCSPTLTYKDSHRINYDIEFPPL